MIADCSKKYSTMSLPLMELQRLARLRSQFIIDQRRTYHATRRTEILPLVAAVVLGTIARYSYRALKRMDDEWKEYQHALQEYRLDNGIDEDEVGDTRVSKPSAAERSTIAQLKEGIVGIDLGTCNIRISHRPPSSDNSTQPSILINREGGRSTSNMIYFDGAGNNLVGRLAQEKMYDKQQSPHRQVLNPHNLLWNEHDGALREMSVREAISSAVKNALETLPTSAETVRSTTQKYPLFSIDPTIIAGRAIRPVFTYPMDHSRPSSSLTESNYENKYKTAVKNLTYPETLALFVPQAVAIVTAAEHYGLLSRMVGEGPVMVIDVGGTETYVSLVSKEYKKLKVVDAFRLEHLGGETLIEALMSHVVKGFYGKDVSDIQDGMALQRIYAASSSAVLELSSNRATARAQMNIPYLTVDDKFQPRHLDMGISKQVLEAEFASVIARRVIIDAKRNQFLSQSLSDPKDLASLMASVILKLLETSRQNPFALRCIIVAGGGSRSPIIQSAIKTGIAQLAGEQYVVDKVVIPKDEQVEELGVLGAALMGAY